MSLPSDTKAAFGLCCPACGQADELCILITTMARVTADRSEPDGDHEWDDTSYCRCPGCGQSGTVADFAKKSRKRGALAAPATIETVGSAAHRVRNALATLMTSCEEALDGRWDRSDDGFEDMTTVAESAIALLDEVQS